MDLDKKVDGPREQMWVSPQDQLMGKMVLTEPFTRQLVQAMTHQNILEIGQNLEEKIENDREEHLKQELIKKEKEIREEMEALEKEKMENLRKEMESIYRNRLQYAKQQIKLKHEEILKERDAVMSAKAETKVRESLACLRESMVEELETVMRQKSESNEEINKFNRVWDANEAQELFKKKTDNFKKKCIKMMKKLRRHCEYEKNEIERNLIDSHSNVFKILQTDWEEKCKLSFHDKIRNYQRTICDLLNQIKKNTTEYDKLKTEIECVHLEQYSWCYLVRELLRQFQKFINYSLREKPGLAEYLLSLEKLLSSRITLLTESEFIRKYMNEKGHLLDERLMAEDPDVRMEALKEIKKEEMARPEYCCLPGDLEELNEEKRKKMSTEETLEIISYIIDKLIAKVITEVKELPCIPSELWSSAKSESQGVGWPVPLKSVGLVVIGDHASCCSEPPWDQFVNDRVLELVRVLNRHPGIKLAIVGNS